MIFSGLEQTFFSGVYGTCISNNRHFGHGAKGLLGISGMFIGAGEIIGKIRIGLVKYLVYKQTFTRTVCVQAFSTDRYY